MQRLSIWKAQPTELNSYGTTPPSSPYGQPIQAGTLDACAAFLRRGIRSDGTYEDAPEGEVAGHQFRLLRGWAAESGLVLPSGFRPSKEGGREHDVAFDEGTLRWFKFTKPNQAGYCVEVVGSEVLMLPATPLQYLDRWRTHNAIFFDDVELVGLVESHAGPRIVVTHADVPGETPSWEEIDHMLLDQSKYSKLNIPRNLGGYDASAFFLGRIGVFDVRPPNCVLSPGGLVIPIDVIPQYFNRSDANTLATFTNS